MRSGGRAGTALVMAACLLLAVTPDLAPPVPADDGRSANALARWHQGPARYLLRGVEAELFRSLETDAERLAFINQFWARRDPSPGSLLNESREEFWKRVARANSLFTRTTVPGWRTDMGKVYITLGPPNDREFDPFPQNEGGISIPITDLSGQTRPVTFGDGSPGQVTRGVERWSYRGLGATTLPTELIIAFRKLSDGDYELSTNPRDIDRFRDSMSSMVQPVDQLMGVEEMEGSLVAQSNARSKQLMSGPDDPGSSTAMDPTVGSDPAPMMIARAQTVPAVAISDAFNRLALALDLGRVGTVPRFEELMGELITSTDFFGVLPFQVETHFYGTTLESTLATVTVGIPHPALESLGVDTTELDMALRIEGTTLSGYRAIHATPGTFIPVPEADREEGLLVLQSVIQVPPGRYRFLVGLRSAAAGLVASGEALVEAPEFSPSELSISTLCLAHRLLPVEAGSPVTADNAVAAFRVGNYHLVPRLERRLGQDDSLSIYYQIYGAQRQEGLPRLRAVYELSHLSRDGETAVGEPMIFNDLRQAVQGWSLPVRGWPAGSYRLRVTVEDLLGGQVTTGQTVFSIRDGPLKSS